MKYTKENIVEGICAKLDELYGDKPTYRGLLKFYKQELPNYPIEIEQNVLEWINNEEISEVDCHGISIKMILSHPNAHQCDFPHVLSNFIKFKNSGFKNSLICLSGLMTL